MTQSEAIKILQSGGNVFLTGSPGSGKTHTVSTFIEWLREEGKVFAVTASTGIAATHINGVTIHSWAGLGIKDTIGERDVAKMNDFTKDRIRSADVLIVDEVSMLDANTIDMIDFVMRNIRTEVFQPFGGLQVVFVGDFFQLPPVSQTRQAKFAFQSNSWRDADLRTCYLTEQHRQSDPVFLGLLAAIRNGTVEEEHKEVLRERRKHEGDSATKLFTHNADVDRLNSDELGKLSGSPHTYRATTGGIPFLVERLTKSCLSPSTLVLKEGAVVMFTRNKPDQSYVNGTLGKVIGFTQGGFPQVETKDGATIIPQRETWKMEENGQIKAQFTQIPLRLAWAITVHKSQGMSLDEASMDLSKTFEYGQGYVAISRVRSLAGLYLKGMNKKMLEVHPEVVEQDKLFRLASGI